MPEGEVPQSLFGHFPGDVKVFMVAPKIMIYIKLTRRAGVSRRVIFRGQGEVTRRAGVSRRIIFRGQGEVDAQVKLDTDGRLAPFN